MNHPKQAIDITIIGAGAAGLFCAALLGQAGLKVKVIDNGKRVGRKILMSGGGRCNFTHLSATADAYLSQNRHFCKSALARYTPWDFLALVNRYQIAYHEKTLGQLFCDDSAQAIVAMLEAECEKGNVQFIMRQTVKNVTYQQDRFIIATDTSTLTTDNVIVATGGLSLPGLGATPIGYQIAEHFGLSVVPTRAGLVPFTLHKPLLASLQTLAGIALPVHVSTERQQFCDQLLFTHRGLSGPAILQISSYWQPGDSITLNLLPGRDLTVLLQHARQQSPKQSIKRFLSQWLPKRLVGLLHQQGLIPDGQIDQLTVQQTQHLVQTLQCWQLQPNGTEGYRTAEVTLGGVNTDELSSKTMESHKRSGLYFIGEVIDVTGQLGGYNFQWAWSSAYACAQAIIATRAER